MTSVRFEYKNPKGQLQPEDMELLERILKKLKPTNAVVDKIVLTKKDGTEKEIRISDIPKIKKAFEGKKK